jgi:hypothetical protein
MSVSEARELDRRLATAAAFNSGEVAEALRGTPAEMTARVLANLVAAVTHLKNGILSTAESGNLYATSALFRVFLKHAMKALTVFIKATHDLSDEFAESYQRLVVTEARQYRTAHRDAKLDEAAAAETFLAPWFGEADKLSRAEAQAMEEPFKYKSMIRTVNELLSNAGANFLTKIIPNYSELSGFVHGGRRRQ